MLDFGYRSRCCLAPIRLGKRKVNNQIKQTWVCTKCRKSNIDIIQTELINSQAKNNKIRTFSEED